MRFTSTRGHGPVSLTTALLEGPAPDGGLYLPERIPRVDFAGAPPEPGLATIAAWTLAPYLTPDLDPSELRRLLADALDFPVPLVRLDDTTAVLELTHGPTAAFKDVGARVLARLLAALTTEDRRRTVLVATSGDTGGAVAAAFHGMEGFRVVVLFPEGRVSLGQRRQFTTLGDNVRAVAVDGPFDACQRLAREAFADAALRAEHGLTSANSLNIGRLLPQVAYYVYAERLAAREWDEAPLFVVPSGNLGNLTAGLLAARMGMPVGGFLAAVNANDAFARYLDGAHPDPDGGTVPTLSSAMDVGRPSNLERLRYLAGGDRRALARDVRARAVGDDETLAWMRRLQEKGGYLADPHTAVGFAALERVRAESGTRASAVVLATAHPGKFPDAVREATGQDPPVPPALATDAGRREDFDGIPPVLEALAELLHR